HHRRIQRHTIGITKPQPVHHPRPEILIHHITHTHQPAHHLPTTIRLQIHSHTLLITVGGQKPGSVEGGVRRVLSVAAAGAVALVRPPVGGQRPHALHLDHLGTQVGQHLGAVGTLHAFGEIQYPDPGEHLRRLVLRPARFAHRNSFRGRSPPAGAGWLVGTRFSVYRRVFRW